jgi:hypothetical protein
MTKRAVIASPFAYCHSDPDSECNEEEGEESHRSGQAPAWQSHEDKVLNSRSKILNNIKLRLFICHCEER